MRINNKKGWLKIVEAIFGILIMAGVLLAVYSAHTTNVKSSERILYLEKELLKDISENYSLRKNVLNSSFISLKPLVSSALDSSFSFSLSICNLSDKVCDGCVNNFSGKEVYTQETIIGSSVNEYSPKIIKISAWSKGSGVREEISCDGKKANGEGCTANEICTSGYCNGTVCAPTPVWYFDSDCDQFGNGFTITQNVRPDYSVCFNTTSEVSTINITDCNDTNASYNVAPNDCVSRWYLDYDDDYFVNASNYTDTSSPESLPAGLNWLKVPTTNLDARSDCDDNNDSITNECRAAIPAGTKWYFDADCDTFRNASLGFVRNITRPTFNGCVNNTTEVPRINESDHRDCDDSNPSIQGCLEPVYPSLLKGLVGYWPFEETSGTITKDYSGRGNNGTCINMGANCNFTSGKVGNAISFDGVNDYVSMGDKQSLELVGDGNLSYCAWFKTSTSGMIISKMLNTGYYLGINAQSVELYSIIGLGFHIGGVAWAKGLVVIDEQWHYVCGVVTQLRYFKLYVDGQLYGSNYITSASSQESSASFLLGTFKEANTAIYIFKGLIDEVAIWNRALNDSEISTLYNLGNAGNDIMGGESTCTFTYSPWSSCINNYRTRTITSSTPGGCIGSNFEPLMQGCDLLGGLVGYWPFDETSGAIASDVSSLGKNGILLNGVLVNQPGKVTNSFYFDGVDDYVSIPKSDVPTEFSGALWFKTDTKITSNLFGKHQCGYPNGFFIFIVGTGGYKSCPVGHVLFNYGNADRYSDYLICSTSSVANNAWHFLYFVKNSTHISLYVDGVFEDSKLTSDVPSANSQDYRIGNLNCGVQFKGYIDAVRLFNRSLSASEISTFYNAEK